MSAFIDRGELPRERNGYKLSNLVIVESPAKAKTIKKYLGKGFEVVASMGHVRDLPKSKLGVDVDNGFAPQYVDIKGKEDLIKDLKKAAKKSDAIYLAPDPDREGEAISWHLAQMLGGYPVLGRQLPLVDDVPQHQGAGLEHMQAGGLFHIPAEIAAQLAGDEVHQFFLAVRMQCRHLLNN